jgi:membrane protease YdiL (CAAX protease family)
MQTPGGAETIAIDSLNWAVRAQLGAVLVVVGLSLAPLTILVARRIFPGRNVVFARWGFSHVFGVVLVGGGMLGLSQWIWPVRADPLDLQVEFVRMAAVLGAVVALIARFAYRLDPEGWRALGLWRGMHARAVATGGVAYVLSWPTLVGLGFVWPWILGKLGIEFEPQSALEAFHTLPRDRIALIVVLGVVVLPFFEEVLFRAFLQPLLVQNFSEKGGVVLTSLFFAAMHGESAFLPVFGLSVVLGSVMLRTQRLTAVWAVHALNNALAFALAGASTP